MGAVRSARQDVRTLRSQPVDAVRLLSARAALLLSMEAYADELTARHLPVPRKLRDDLRLMRDVRSRRLDQVTPSAASKTGLHHRNHAENTWSGR